MSETNPEPEKCPKCGSAKALPICYGFPDLETLYAAKAGKIVLGGCLTFGGEPAWQCGECDHKWGELDINLATKKPGDD